MLSWTSPHGRSLPDWRQRTLIMGILNATPDSFSDGGQLSTVDLAVSRARDMIAGGADILDLGGESTRPGAKLISADEELSRVLPIMSAIRRTWPEIAISVDTYKATVAEEAIKAGADMVNDVWGLTHGLTDQQRFEWRSETARADIPKQPLRTTPMASLIARLRCPVVLMHNRPRRDYADFWADVLLDLKTSIQIALTAGIEGHQLWVDPGFGFAKDVGQNLEVLRDLNRVCSLGYPVLVGTSRKSTLGVILGSKSDDRLEGTGATAVWAIQQGARMIRVHDVREMTRFARMADAIKLGIEYRPS
jgi:dihydropteroate synthase